MKKWNEMTENERIAFNNAIRRWLADPKNSCNCEECPYNEHSNSNGWQGQYPCGQFHCWVDLQ